MFGLGKKRSKLGRYLDKRGIKQQWLADVAKLNKKTVSQLASEEEYIPTGNTMKKVLQAIRKIDPNVKQDDFWTM
ncbi:transcriptional regulator [Brevibacillus ginsengisoli]|uniref:transcriptional regulator n=1 Tax=Brevibacillus ginsengisoli TaxID=363854 RepID=UPI003CF28403